MRNIYLIATISLLLCACGTPSIAPISYEERVTVQSVLPVHVRLNTTESAIYSATTINFAGQRAGPGNPGDNPVTAFDTNDQLIFVSSLKTELVRHGVFGSISESGGKGVVDLDFYFIETGPDAHTGEHRLSVALAARYRGQVTYFAYDVSSPDGKTEIAEELLNEVMGDVQAFVDEQRISIRAGIKDRSLDISRMLVKW